MTGGAGSFAVRFGRNLAYCRQRAGNVSQEELGMRADMHRTAVGQLERGERVPRSDTLVKLSSSLGVSYDDLLDGLAWTPSTRTIGALTVEPFADEGKS